MITSRNLILENRFSDPQAFALRFEVEPTVLPLESALYRALNEKFAFQTVGGTPEGLGAGRYYSIGGEGWQTLVASMLAKADIILMLPHDSPGVPLGGRADHRCPQASKVVFIMPPDGVGGTGRSRTLERRCVHDAGLQSRNPSLSRRRPPLSSW